MYVLPGGENKIQYFDLLANKSVPLAESQHKVLEKAGSHYQKGESMSLHPSFTTCVILDNLLSLYEPQFSHYLRDTIIFPWKDLREAQYDDDYNSYPFMATY